MTEIVTCREDLASELASWGRLQGFYLRQGVDLVEVPGRRGRWGRLRFLRGDSALVRTLETRPGSLVSRTDTGDPFGEALLEELGAEAVLLVRYRGRLLAAASLCNLDPTRPFVDADARTVAARFAARISAHENPPLPDRKDSAEVHGAGGKLAPRE